MATYYRWRKSTLSYEEYNRYTFSVKAGYGLGTFITTIGFSSYKIGTGKILDKKTGIFSLSNITKQGNIGDEDTVTVNEGEAIVIGNQYVEVTSGPVIFEIPPDYYLSAVKADIAREFVLYESRLEGAGIFLKYIYSLNASEYPTDGQSGDYWYDQRTTITSPTAPTGLRYPNPIITSSSTVSWTASVTNVPIYAVSTYEVSYSTNGGSTWTVAGTTADTSLSVTLPTGATSIQFRVRAKDSNGQWSSYATGTASTVLLSPTLTVPSMAMQGQQITVNWTAIDGATSYTLQRQANTDDGWVQVYSGNALTFTETVGTWTTVQYQVQAVFSSGAGGWATSGSIPVVSASALVISGQDEDLGLITHDVPYTVSTDTGNPISLTRSVNGVQVASLTVENGFAYDIPVMDLPTGEGTIVISASVNTSGGSPVTATRTWTYTKTACIFPNVGSTAQLTLQGENIFPPTLAECVRVGENLGGDLGHALEMLTPLILRGSKVFTDMYDGTSTYGENNPTELTFPFVPDLWGYFATVNTKQSNSSFSSMVFSCIPWGLDVPNEVVVLSGGGGVKIKEFMDTTVSFYADSAADQANHKDNTYWYYAIKIG